MLVQTFNSLQSPAIEVQDFVDFINLRNNFYCYNLSTSYNSKSDQLFKKMTRINSKVIAAFLCSLCILVYSSCSSPKQEENQEEAFEQVEDQVQRQIEGLLDNVPPPSEIPFLIQSTGAGFNMDLVNDISNVDNYKSENDKSALNLGVYSTDIGYLSSYDQSQDALTYFSEIKSLADQIGVTSELDDDLVASFEENLGSREKLGSILDNAVGDTRITLEESGRDQVAALVATGTFTEALHIVGSLINEFPKGEVSADDPNSSFIALAIPLVQMLLDQEKAMGELNTLLKSFDSSPTNDQLVAMTSDLVEEYASLNIQETMESNQGVSYLQEGKLDGLLSKIEALRNYITG
jgi:hypothetical protein